VFSTLAYASAALVVASRLFGAANSSLGSQSSWSDLILRPAKVTELPEPGLLAIYLAGLLPVFFVISNLGAGASTDTATILGLNAVLLGLLFGIGPACVAWYQRLSFPKTFLLGLGRGNGLGIAIAVTLLASSMWILALEAFVLLKSWSLIEQVRDLESIKAKALAVPFAWVLITQSLAPAVFEEFFFRGFALSSLCRRLSSRRAIVLSALLFGLFHVIDGSVLSFEKLIPTFLLGLALGLVAVRTQSIIPGMILHAAHNALVLSFTRIDAKWLESWFGTSEHMPMTWIAGSCLAITLGVSILFVSTKNRTRVEL
jgi:sodium transport system permease protein